MDKWLKRAKKADPLLEDLSSVFFRKRNRDKDSLREFSGWSWADDSKEVAHDQKKLSEWPTHALEEVALILDLIEQRAQHQQEQLVNKIVNFCQKPYSSNIGATVKPDASKAKTAPRGTTTATAGSSTRTETEREQLQRLKTEREKLDRRIAKLEEKLGPTSVGGSRKRKATQGAVQENTTPKKRKTTAAKKAEAAAKEVALENGDKRAQKRTTTSSKRVSSNANKQKKRRA